MSRSKMSKQWRCLAAFPCYLLLIAVAAIWSSVEAASQDSLVETIRMIYSTYDKNIRPTNEADPYGPTKVEVDLYVISLSAISEKNMDFTVNMYIRQRWRDSRLANANFSFPSGALINNKIDDTWIPDIFIKNDKISKKSDVTVANSFLRVDETGQILYSMRVTSTIACSMQLSRYPFDEQECEVLFESYGHTTRELTFAWKELDVPVEINDKIELPEHIIEQTNIANCTKTYNTTGSYSCISASFVFARNINYYIMNLFVPSILIVVLSWVSFWIDKSSTPGRVSLSLLTILTMQNQMSATLAQLPKVSYIKLVDVWLTGCLGFVFAGFLEYALVNKLATKERDDKQKYSMTEGLRDTASKLHTGMSNGDEDTDINSNGTRTDQKDVTVPMMGGPPKTSDKMGLADKVDFYSRFLFPFTFLLFNVILWSCYLIPKEYL